MSFTQLENKYSADAVCENIKLDLINSNVAPGTRLQPLRNLTKKYNTSYLTLQHAFQKLKTEGIVSVRQGAGVFLRDDYLSKLGKKVATHIYYHTKTGDIAMVFAGLRSYIVNTPVYTEVFHGVETEASKLGLNLIVCQIPDAKYIPEKIIRGQVDGLLLLGNESLDGLMEKVGHVPCVWMMGQNKNWGDHITYDNYKVGIVAAQYAFNKGHNNVACFNVLANHGEERCKAFCKAIQEIGGTVKYFSDVRALVQTEGEQHIDHEVVRKWIEEVINSSPKPTGIFVDGDMLAVVVHNELLERGVKPGKDISIISCNFEKSLTASLMPQPASVDIGCTQIGQLAVRQLMWRRENPDATRLIIRIEPNVVRCGMTK